MKRWKVEIVECKLITVVVEAADQYDAQEKAEEMADRGAGEWGDIWYQDDPKITATRKELS